DRGVVLAWWGTLRAPAQEGDRLALHYDLSVQMPDVGGSWSLAAGISAWDFGQSNSIAWRPIDEEQLGAGTHQLSGTVYSRTVESWDIQAGSPLIYWQVAVAASAGWPWGERYWSDHYGSWVTPFRGVSLTVPNQSIDVTFLTSPAPEPASHGVWLAGLTGLWILRRTKARE
ncbi:MAG: hypothetical protein Q7N95_10915, partial [Alphaproteobacteria bacterium]|nr:hypothetical protein [Alphaproteobacteria bacterium]